MKTEWAAYNFSGSQTGTGWMRRLEDGRIHVTAAFGSSFGGGVCDDGPEYEAVVATEEEAERWLRSHRME